MNVNKYLTGLSKSTSGLVYWTDNNRHLPRRLFNSRNLAFIGVFSEADSAQAKISHIAALTTAQDATQNLPGTKLGLL